MSTRKAEEIDFIGTCIISGLDKNTPLYALLCTKEIIVREDFANFIIELLHCKFDLLDPKSVVLKWTNENDYKLPVYATSAKEDYECTARILYGFAKKFMESDATKITY
jgi:hypothetical protein